MAGKLIIHGLDPDDINAMDEGFEDIGNCLIADETTGFLGDGKWEFREYPSQDLIPHAQRVVAATILAAIQLPQPASDYAMHLLDACDVAPGMAMGPSMNGNRVETLKHARTLLDALITEAENAR